LEWAAECFPLPTADDLGEEPRGPTLRSFCADDRGKVSGNRQPGCTRPGTKPFGDIFGNIEV